MNNIIFTGRPGSGKGTQAALLADHLKVPHISTGDIFRNHMRLQTPLGVAINDLMKAGEYVSDDITNRIVAERLQENDVQNGFILDGYPRTLEQVKFFDQSGMKIDKVINFELKPEAAIRRIVLRSREFERGDDTATIAEERMNVYERTVTQVIKEYSSRGILHNINAELGIQKVQDNVLFFF